MRPAFACLLALGLTQCAPPPAAPPAEPPVVAEEAVPDAAFCARPAEKQAFQVAALKSRLMVTALACDSSEKYNAFITANRTALLPQEKTLGGYFQRYYGRRAQTEHDEYITNLANAQSRRRIIPMASSPHAPAPPHRRPVAPQRMFFPRSRRPRVRISLIARV